MQLARRLAPLSPKRGLASLAGSLGIEVDEVHRALPDALTCARVFCALFPRLCANAPTVADALDLLRSRRRARKTEPAERIPPSERPDLSTLPDDPGVYIFRDERGAPLYVGKSVSLRSRARAHFCAPAGWTEKAAIVDYRPTNSELGALVLENRLIKAWKPSGNVKLKRTDRYCYLRCRLDIPYPVLDVAPEPAPGHAVNVGPLGSRTLASELADQLTSLYRLRHCGRRLKLREHPSAYGQMGRCVSPCLGDLDPNAYRRQLDLALAPFERPGAGETLIAELDRRMAEASAERRYERAAALRRRRDRLAWVLERLEGVLRATHAAPRLVLARHPVKERFDAFWLVRGRLVDWGPLPGASELAERTERALDHPPGRTVVPKDEVDEVRIVASWVAEHEPAELALDPAPRRAALMEFAGPRVPSPVGVGPAGSARLGDRPLGCRETDLGVGAVAERLGLGPAAAAQGDRLAALTQVVFAPVGVDQPHRPGDLVGPVVASLDLDLLHSLSSCRGHGVIVPGDAANSPVRPSRGARDRAVAPLRGPLSPAPPRERARGRGRG